MMNNSAYWAGVADSDGSFSICINHKSRENPHYACSFQLSWTDTPLARKTIEELVAIYGGSYNRTIPSGTKLYPNTRPVIHYWLAAKKLEPFLIDVIPFLRLKRKQARTLMRLRKVTRPASGGPKRSERMKRFQHKLYLLNKSLNTKNGTVKC